MSAKEKKTAATPAGRKEIVRGFDVKEFRAPFVLRCGALMIDYIVVLLIPVASLILGRFLQYDGAKLLNSEINNTGWLITILLCLTNFFIFPLFSGQTIGKMITGLRIVRLDGTAPGLRDIFLRHVIGYPITFFSAMLGFVLVLFNQSGRALHDFLSGTVVVYGSPVRKIARVSRSKAEPKKSKTKARLA